MQDSPQFDELRWRRRSVNDCAWAEYGDSCVIYHRPSGMTHLLNGASVRLLTDVLLEPRNLDTIVGAFLPEHTDSDPAQFRMDFLSILSRLEYFGLVEKLAPR